MARILENRGVRLGATDLLINSDIPTGAGLSSSAALEISAGLALTEINEQSLDRRNLALNGRQTEHEYVGVKVGIMDQCTSANAVRRHALLIDCASLEFEAVPLKTADVAVVICDTNVKHNLKTSADNDRKLEYEKGIVILREFFPHLIRLREIISKEFARFENRLPEPVRRRARHVVSENERVLQPAEFLRRATRRRSEN